MAILSILVRVCIWVLGFYKLKDLGVLMDSFEFCSLNCGYVIVPLSLFA